jgi:hypothetical protein
MDASTVSSPVGTLSTLLLLSADGHIVGKVEGVIIEPAAGRVRYFVVQSNAWFGRRRYLLEADQLAQVERGRKALRLRVDFKDAIVHDLDTRHLRRFSDDDLITTLFSSQAA